MENIAHEGREKLSSFDYREGIDSPFVVVDFLSQNRFYIGLKFYDWHETTHPSLPVFSCVFSPVIPPHRLKFCCTFRSISVSILSQTVVVCEINLCCSWILNSTWISATQHAMDSNNPDVQHKRSSDVRPVVSWRSVFPCFIAVRSLLATRVKALGIKCHYIGCVRDWIAEKTVTIQRGEMRHYRW